MPYRKKIKGFDINTDKTLDNNFKSKIYFIDIESLVCNALALLISRKGISKIDMKMLNNYEKSVILFLKKKGYKLIITDEKFFIKTLETNFHSLLNLKIEGSKNYIEAKSSITS